MLNSKRNNIWINLGIILFFCLFTLLLTGIFIKKNLLYPSADSVFHFSRVEEIYNNLKNGEGITYIASHTFNSTGVASFLFYPAVLNRKPVFLVTLQPILEKEVWNEQ